MCCLIDRADGPVGRVMKNARLVGRSASVPFGINTGRTVWGLVRRGLRAVALVAALCAVSTGARAQNTWTAGSATDTSWDTNTNWSLGLKPVALDDVIF